MNAALRCHATVTESSNSDFYGCKGLDLIHRTKSDFAIHLTASIIGEAESILSRTRAALAPAKPVLRILDRIDPLAKLAAMR
jgi:hypothetical protein